jgi:hypothetical protein
MSHDFDRCDARIKILLRKRRDMNAIKEVRRYLLRNPASASSKTLAKLTAALAEEQSFPLGDLYALEQEGFDLAIELMRDWRLDRYYAARIKLFDVVLGGDGEPAAARPAA